MEKPIAWGLPLTIAKIPRLSLHSAINWLINRNINIDLLKPDRRLCALLIAKYGHGVIFIDAIDPDDQIRFSLAHEVAHFLMDYIEPREIALKKIGGQIQEVLDGKRSPTSEERFTGILRGVELNWYSHFLDRNFNGDVGFHRILNSEDRADLLAIELLAPIDSILLALKKEGIDLSKQGATKKIISILVNTYGLPIFVAKYYSRFLSIRKKSRQSFKQWLKGK